jgi:hypothetical protein
MKQEIFNLQVTWSNRNAIFQIKTQKVVGSYPVMALYEVHYYDTYLFSVYPTFTPKGNKIWEIVEKEREKELPPGFLGILGKNIEEVYVMN